MQFKEADPERDMFGFKGQANLYNKIRPLYPEQLYEELFSQLPTDKRRVCLDIGCGTG